MKSLRQSLIHTALLASFLFGFGLTVAPAPAYAQGAIDPGACQRNWGGFLGLPTWYKYLLNDPPVVASGPDAGECNLDRFRQGTNNYDYNYLLKIAMAIFEIIMRIAALAAVGFVIFGGYQFLISTGEPDKLAGARTTIVNALIGLVITIMAVAIVNLVGGSLLPTP